MKKPGLDLSLLDNVVDTLRQGRQLDAKYRDHELSGKLKGFRECLLDCRIRQACILLKDTDLSIRAIAHSVSYIDPLAVPPEKKHDAQRIPETGKKA